MKTPETSRRPGLRLAALAGVALGLLALFSLLPRLDSRRLDARRINCEHNLKSLGLAMRMYAGDFDGCFPSELRLLATQGYHTAMKVYTCPNTSTIASPTPEEFDQARHCDYVYLGAGLTEDCRDRDPTRTIIMHERPGNHKSYLNVLFADGRVGGYRGSDIEAIARRKGLVIPKSKESGLDPAAAP